MIPQRPHSPLTQFIIMVAVRLLQLVRVPEHLAGYHWEPMHLLRAAVHPAALSVFLLLQEMERLSALML